MTLYHFLLCLHGKLIRNKYKKMPVRFPYGTFYDILLQSAALSCAGAANIKSK